MKKTHPLVIRSSPGLKERVQTMEYCHAATNLDVGDGVAGSLLMCIIASVHVMSPQGYGLHARKGAG